MPNSPTLMWFRQDLRLADNPALRAAADSGRVLPVYILDDVNAGDWQMGRASRWWLHQSLQALDAELNNRLWLLAGDPLELIPRLVAEHGIKRVVWNRCYESWRIRRDKKLKQILQDQDLEVESFNGSLLWEPWRNLKGDGEPYRVFTPFYKNGLAKLGGPESPVEPPRELDLVNCTQGRDKLDRLELMPTINWVGGLAKSWTPGERAARQRLKTFLEQGLGDYREGRDYPARNSVSGLSPHLHFGEISPAQVWHASAQAAAGSELEAQAEHFQRELAWREFSYALLYHFPHLTRRNMNEQFNDFPWTREQKLLRRWQQGETGYPLVDAGMRELWTTGYMHNRVRMVVGSFLVKNLLHHWLDGARLFWDCLVDADLASNTASWQWVAGCGADAAPYFRIFNPTTQSQKFDPGGAYIRLHVPELKGLPDKYLHEPSRAPGLVLQEAGVALDKDYPRPIVDLAESRQRALAAYQSIKQSR